MYRCSSSAEGKNNSVTFEVKGNYINIVFFEFCVYYCIIGPSSDVVSKHLPVD